MMSAWKYWLWLTSLPGLKNQSRLLLLRHFGAPENIYFAEPPEFARVEGLERQQAALLANRSLDEAERILDQCQKLKIGLLTIQDAGYPDRLRNIYDPPCLLYVKGRLPALDEEIVVSVVGTRKCTPYGISAAESVAYGLATGGAIVASGLARGVDSAAIRGALLGGGVTIGVLGNGLDVVYPRENVGLYRDVETVGALISEYPPGTAPLPGNFPVRNRILSGIAVGALVVEAPLHSGALITASRALEQGRDVFAVPGPIGAYTSRGCNRLIHDGAGLVADAMDILETYAARFPGKVKETREIPVIVAEPSGTASGKRRRSSAAPDGAMSPSGAPGTFDARQASDSAPGTFDTRQASGTPGTFDTRQASSGAPGTFDARQAPSGAPGTFDARQASGTPGTFDTRQASSGAPGTFDARQTSGTPDSVSAARAADIVTDAAIPAVSVAEGTVSPEQARLLRLMDLHTPVHVDELIERSGLSARQALSELTMLQIDGFIRQHAGKRYTRLVDLRDDEENHAL